MKRVLDWPQSWFLIALLLVWGSTGLLNLQNRPWPGAVLLAIGAFVFLTAVVQMRRAQTTLNPHGQPSRLLTGGVFAISRNPIYLGNLVMILSLSLWIGAPLGLLVAAGFCMIVTRRFILAEESRLRASFGPDYEAWAGRVRRWG